MSTAERFSISDQAFSKATVEQHVARYSFAKDFVKGRRVLDVACGSGYGTAMLCDAGAADVIGVDASATAVEACNQHQTRPNVSFRVGDAQRLNDFAAATFDVVVSFETIEHLPDDKAFLASVHRVLKPDGLFICSTPDGRLESTMFGLTGKPRNGHHLREYVLADFEKLIGERFEIQTLHGQVFVGRIWVPWFVQVVVKGLERVTRPVGLFRQVAARYHFGKGTNVAPAKDHKGYVAKYWTVVCRPKPRGAAEAN